MQSNAVTAVGEHADPDAASKLIVGAVGMVDLDDPPELAQLRVFAGYAGWGEGQLDDEVEQEAWILEPALPTIPSRRRPLGRVLERMGDEFALLARMPTDPSDELESSRRPPPPPPRRRPGRGRGRPRRSRDAVRHLAGGLVVTSASTRAMNLRPSLLRRSEAGVLNPSAGRITSPDDALALGLQHDPRSRRVSSLIGVSASTSGRDAVGARSGGRAAGRAAMRDQGAVGAQMAPSSSKSRRARGAICETYD